MGVCVYVCMYVHVCVYVCVCVLGRRGGRQGDAGVLFSSILLLLLLYLFIYPCVASSSLSLVRLFVLTCVYL